MKLPALPDPSAPITIQIVEKIEARVAVALGSIEDVEILNEWRDQADALSVYLKRRALDAPMRGALRRTEARLGQLLPAKQGRRLHSHEKEVDQATRSHFRTLARALDGEIELAPEEWRSSRRALLRTIHERAGEPVPNGGVWIDGVCPTCRGTGRAPLYRKETKE